MRRIVTSSSSCVVASSSFSSFPSSIPSPPTCGGHDESE